ncbi:hypothetical protein P7K49_022420 [Saguinus oedipus]|uniref:Uncharacterized protein n=1 Tax=Saguinus oedipus TaxID=9490 RepID=A0ABQ9UVF7_SAGOE|nr:hypothetical protein P7K49_022420 [Saguinus oedipus]
MTRHQALMNYMAWFRVFLQGNGKVHEQNLSEDRSPASNLMLNVRRPSPTQTPESESQNARRYCEVKDASGRRLRWLVESEDEIQEGNQLRTSGVTFVIAEGE